MQLSELTPTELAYFDPGDGRLITVFTDETRERLAYGEWKGWEEWVERVEAGTRSA